MERVQEEGLRCASASAATEQTSKSSSSTTHDISTSERQEFFSEAKESKRLGFRALLAWHYLVLFAPLVAVGGEQFSDLIVSRQLILYSVLAVTFFILLVVSRCSQAARERLASPAVTITSAVIASAVTLASLYNVFDFNLGVVRTVFLGISEAFLMYTWLLFFADLARKGPYRTLGMDIMMGSLIALLVGSLISPANMVVAACLPLLSMASFVSLKKKYDFWKSEGHGLPGSMPDSMIDLQSRTYEATSAYMVKRNVASVLFAVAFGLMQGSYLSDGVPFLIAFNPLMFLGVTLAGVVIFNIKERFCTHSDAETMYRPALIFFMVGIVVLTVLGVASIDRGSLNYEIAIGVAGLLIFAGFNLFDFGNMMLCLGIVRASNAECGYLIALGRSLTYAFMALGFAMGYVFVTWVMPLIGVEVLVISSCVAMFLLLITIGLPSSTKAGYESLLTKIGSDVDSNDAFVQEMKYACKNCGSVDDCDVRGAVLGNLMKSADDKAANEREMQAIVDGHAAEVAALMKKIEEVESELAKSAAEAEEASRIARGGGAETPKQERERKPAMVDGEEKRKSAPWRDACTEIAHLYQLSKRETEIFHIISKGRNADYVSKELYISVHTAKTHIANIYQKLDIHSSQEMLDLIDTFRSEILKREKGDQ